MLLLVGEPTDQLLVAMSQLNAHLSNTTSGIVTNEKVYYCIFLISKCLFLVHSCIFLDI